MPSKRHTRRTVLGSLAGGMTLGTAGCLRRVARVRDASDADGGVTRVAADELGDRTDTEALRLGGSSTLYPVANDAAAYWNGNRPASDSEYWPHEEFGIETDLALADYWAGRYGFEPTGSQGEPPYRAMVALSQSGTGVKNVRDGAVDIGNSSGDVEDELPDRLSYDRFVGHVVAADGQPVVVSSEIREAGVDSITDDQLRDLYKGRITNWSELGGPDREIQVLGSPRGSGSRTAFVANVFGDPEADTTVVNRFGQNQRLAMATADSDAAISYLAMAFLDTDGLEPLGLEWDGTTYRYGAEEHGFDAEDYPLSRDLHMYTWDGTSEREAAYLDMVLSEFGQQTFVAENDYVTLSESCRDAQREKLPDPD